MSGEPVTGALFGLPPGLVSRCRCCREPMDPVTAQDRDTCTHCADDHRPAPQEDHQ